MEDGVFGGACCGFVGLGWEGEDEMVGWVLVDLVVFL